VQRRFIISVAHIDSLRQIALPLWSANLLREFRERMAEPTQRHGSILPGLVEIVLFTGPTVFVCAIGSKKAKRQGNGSGQVPIEFTRQPILYILVKLVRKARMR
jgi:hypothetical protein